MSKGRNLGTENYAYDKDYDTNNLYIDGNEKKCVLPGSQSPSIVGGTDFVGECCSRPAVLLPSKLSGDDSVVKLDKIEVETGRSDFGLEYGVEDNPPIHMSFVFGLQQVLLSISSTITIPIIVSREICAGELEVVKSEIMSTFLFMCGICTILQDTIGVRLPIIQGGCHKFLPAVVALMTLEKWKCPENMVELTALENTTNIDNVTEIWQSRMREIQGGIMVASVTQVLIGCTGLLGILLQYIGPLTIVPTITLVGLSLVDVSLIFCEKHWGIAAMTICLVFLFSLYLRDILVPVPAWTKEKGCHIARTPLFKLLPVLLAVIIAWAISEILTATGNLTYSSKSPGNSTKTDDRLDALHNAKWFLFPYPGQWGTPTVSLASYMAMLAPTLTSIIESVGDYYASARLSCVPPPPAHAVNRGIAIEGFGSILSGAVGSGGATTSYSQNVGSIGFTKVASRRAFQMAGLIFLLCGIFGKFGAFLTLMPDPILGGVLVISFGMVTSVGLSTLQFVNLSSGRNLCIVGSSLLVGLMLPKYIKNNEGVIQTGNTEADQVLTVLLSTAMFVGGVLGFILDNTVPGTEEDRGILKWRNQVRVKHSDTDNNDEDKSVYDLPLIMPLLRKCRCSSYIPFLPTFTFAAKPLSCSCCKIKNNENQQNSDDQIKHYIDRQNTRL